MSYAQKDQQRQWHYMSEMTPVEIIVFEGYDADQSKPGWRYLHTAIKLPESDHDPPRESIEACIVCFWN